MKKAILRLFVGLTLLLWAQSAIAGHYWYNGRVTDIKPGAIHVDNKEYSIAQALRVVQHVMTNGMINELPAKVEEVFPGQRVSVKIENGVVVSEIIIERYR